MKIKFYDNIDENLLKFAVIISKYNGKWVFCKHKERTTYEIPGGHKEEGESIYKAAERELTEETGALRFTLKPICVYSVTGKNRVNSTGEETFGMLFFAEIMEFSDVINSEIEYIKLFDDLPKEWTYPQIQPFLIEEYIKRTRQN
ncbi:MAG: NUDIX domain-containing protein [Clostridia bacterium]|nr:NUDIX domain-containing protein [Clostridia bacterium]